MSLQRTFRYYYLRFKRLRGSPQALAGGTAIGVLVGLTPTVPLHTLLILILSLVTRSSALAAIIVSWIVCNPLTFFPIYYLSATVGNFVTPYELSMDRVTALLTMLQSVGGWYQSLKALLALGREAIIVMVGGSLCFALPISIICYFFSLSFFQKRDTYPHRS